MKIIISFILTIITLNSVTYFWQWLHEKEFDIYGWFSLYIPPAHLTHRMDYAVLISLWIVLTLAFIFAWEFWYVSLVEIEEDNGE